MKHTEETYGFLPGGDPRRFVPDHEVNTPAEKAAWSAACDAWNRGERVEPAVSPPGRVYQREDGKIVKEACASSYGLGTYTIEWDCHGHHACEECRDDEPGIEEG